MFGFQELGQLFVMALILFHGTQVFFLGFGNGFDFRRHHKLKCLFAHIALALHAVGSDAVAGDLCQQRTGNTLDAKGKAGMFDGAFVADFRKHIQEGSGLLFCKAVQDGLDGGGRIAKFGGTGDQGLRHRRISKKLNLHIDLHACRKRAHFSFNQKIL